MTEGYCPQCSAEWVCPCRSCDTGGVSKWAFEGDNITCACGFKRHSDWWLDRDWERMKKMEAEEDSKS